ncbi:MAG TPA: hypothetical protein VF748_14720 [Candidatus Acidoferrum sp.]
MTKRKESRRTPPQTFSARMRLCAVRGRMTKSDMARWFRRPYHTVSHWWNDGTEPWGPNGDEALRKLFILEEQIKEGEHFPIPFDLSPAQRIKYLEGVLHDLRDRLSQPRAAE